MERLKYGVEPKHLRQALDDAWQSGVVGQPRPTEKLIKRFLEDSECEACS